MKLMLMLLAVVLSALATVGLGADCEVYDAVALASAEPTSIAVNKNGSIFASASNEVLRLSLTGGVIVEELIAGDGTAENGGTSFNSDATAFAVSAASVFSPGVDSDVVYIVTKNRFISVDNGVATEEMDFVGGAAARKATMAALSADVSRILTFATSGSGQFQVVALEVEAPSGGDEEVLLGTGDNEETSTGFAAGDASISDGVSALALQPASETLYWSENNKVRRVSEAPGSVVEEVMVLDTDTSAGALSFNPAGDVLFVLQLDAPGSGKLLAINVTDDTVAEVLDDAGTATWAQFFPRAGPGSGSGGETEGSLVVADTVEGEVAYCNFTFADLVWDPISLSSSSPTGTPTKAPSTNPSTNPEPPGTLPPGTAETSGNTELILAVSGTAGGCAGLALLLFLHRRRRSSNDESKIVHAIALSVAQIDLDEEMGTAVAVAVAVAEAAADANANIDANNDDDAEDVPLALASVPQLHTDAKFSQ